LKRSWRAKEFVRITREQGLGCLEEPDAMKLKRAVETAYGLYNSDI